MSSWIDLHAIWRIVVVGLLAGAGLPALFALGLRALSAGPRTATVNGADDDRVYGGHPLGLIVAALCFAVVLAAIGLGIYSIVNSA
jgi:hypothetical protein